MDDEFMREALKMAEEALQVGEVPIGCVIVDENNQIISRGRNRTNESKNATRHAEFEALADISSTSTDLSSLRLYVTVEPCIMCAAALRRVGLLRVFFSCYNERFGGCGSIIPAHCDYIDVDPPLEVRLLVGFRKECVGLLRLFYLCENEKAPNPKKKNKRVFKPVDD